MSYNNTVWAQFERWNPVPFLLAGGVYGLIAAVYGFRAGTGTGLTVPPPVIFVCLLVVFVGLLGLYPRLASGNPLLALCGLGFLALTTAVIFTTIGLTVLPLGVTLGKPTIVALIMSVVGGSTLTLTTFGVAGLRTGGHLRPVGGFLLVMATGTAGVVVAMFVYSNPTPAWVGFVVSLVFVISLGSIGYVFRREDVPVEPSQSSGDVTAD